MRYWRRREKLGSWCIRINSCKKCKTVTSGPSSTLPPGAPPQDLEQKTQPPPPSSPQTNPLNASKDKAGGGVTKTANVDGALKIPMKENPAIGAIYGQICVAPTSCQSVIFYLLHAYDYYPNDPMICLYLAIASIGRVL
ncbi:hypothetical protein BJ165DRAFT_341355 [Panaeolus papilionaceus]|nr:hypothetical protein BJ165DRAFT_341355 [Panaeolus papilionaceus]